MSIENMPLTRNDKNAIRHLVAKDNLLEAYIAKLVKNYTVVK